jgi:nitrate reductase delta subunit
MFAFVRKSPGRLQVIERVTQWTRERFKLPKEAVISVLEIACSLPGCPPLETVVAFWIAEQRYQFKLFKPVEEMVIGDLPYAWLKDALAVQDGAGWECC